MAAGRVRSDLLIIEGGGHVIVVSSSVIIILDEQLVKWEFFAIRILVLYLLFVS